jgi:predicted XRE-type DNA-binding protein
MTSDDDMTIIQGSGNLFRDLGLPDPEVRQTKALLAAEIIKTLDERKLSVRAAHSATGIAAADFSRIRNVNLSRFTIDRLISILGRLDREVEVSVSVRARPQAVQSVALPA